MRERILRYFRGHMLERLGQLVNLVGIVIAIGWFVPLALVHMKVITQPGPQEFNEPAIWQTTWLLDHGRNPYSANELPASTYCFDPLYNYVMLAFKPLLGIDYTAHRMVNLLFLVLCLTIMVRMMCKAGAGLGIALLSAVLFYWMCLDNIMITARPDLMGLFFFLLGILVPWERNFTRGSTIFGLACALIAFHCKSYFVLAGCATLLGHFFVTNKKEAFWMGVAFFGLVILTFLLWCYFFPYYYIVTVVVQREAAKLNSHEDISLMHTTMLFSRGWPFFVAMVYGLCVHIWRRHKARREGRPVNRPGDVKLQVLALVYVIFLLIVYFYMGWNAGAYFTYHLHLLFPLMFVLTALALDGPWARIGFGVLMAVFVMAGNRAFDQALGDHDFLGLRIYPVPDSTAPYRRMEQLIYTCNGEVLGIASNTDMFERTGRPVLHNGNTMFIGFAFANNGIGRDPMIAVLGQKSDQVNNDVTRKVANREYALIFTEFDSPYFCTTELLKQNYDKEEQIDYFTYFGHSPVRVWRPKPRG